MSTLSTPRKRVTVASKIDTGLRKSSAQPSPAASARARRAISTPPAPTTPLRNGKPPVTPSRSAPKQATATGTPTKRRPMSLQTPPRKPLTSPTPVKKPTIKRSQSTASDATLFDNYELDEEDYLVPHARPQSSQPVLQVNVTLPIACGICKQRVTQPVVCPNRHVFCDECMQDWLKRRPQCPSCKVKITNENPCLPLVGDGADGGVKSIENGVAAISLVDIQESRDRAALRQTQIKRIVRDYDDEISALQRNVLSLREQCVKLQDQHELRKNSLTSPTSPRPRGTTMVSAAATTRTPPSELLRQAQDEIAGLQQQVQNLTLENESLKSEMATIVEEAARLRRSSFSFTPEPSTDDAIGSTSRSPTPTGPGGRRGSILSKLAGGPIPAIKLKLAMSESARLKSRASDLEKENESLTNSLQRSEEYIAMLQRKIKNLESLSGLGEVSDVDLMTSLSFEEMKKGEIAYS